MRHYTNVRYQKVQDSDLSMFRDEFFDLVFSHDVFVHFEPFLVYRYYREIGRVLKAEGKSIISFYNIDRHFRSFKRQAINKVGFSPGRIWYYNLGMLQKMVEEAGQKIVEINDKNFLIIVTSKL